MKRISYIILACAAALTFTGCEKNLDIPQKGVIPATDFYFTVADAQSALTSVYYSAGRWLSNSMQTEAGWNECPFLSMWSYASDDMFVAGSDKTDGVSGNEIQSFRATSTNGCISGTYQAYNYILNACNQLICVYELPDHPCGDDAEVKKCVAEARVIRAYVQHLLALGWGTAPIVDHIMTADEKPFNEESQEYVLQWCADECDKAIPYLTSKSSINDVAKCLIVTKEFAYAVKGKALISKKDYPGAKAAFKEVITSNKYDLVPGEKMSTLNHNNGKASVEAVFELAYNFESSLGNYYRSQPNFRPLWNWRSSQLAMMPNECDGNGWGWCNPSQKFVNAILENDGPDSYRRKAWIKSYDEVLYELSYPSDATCTTPEAKSMDNGRGIKPGMKIYGNCGWFMWKRLFRPEAGDKVMSDGNVADWNLTVMRYAEVLLLYAECCAQTNDPDGLQYLQAVAQRAGSQTIPSVCDMPSVKKEKFIECWLDGTRFQDLVRWGDAATELKEGGWYYPSWGDKIEVDDNGKTTKPHEGYLDESDADWCKKQYGDIGFKSGKSELFPFPFSEININYNINQNPGY